MQTTIPAVTSEIFVIPVDNQYLVYAPLRQSAVLANAAVVNALADLQEGHWEETCTQHQELIELLRRLEMIDAADEVQPITTFEGQPQPTSVTLFLTTACNLRCTYCYAAAGDTPTRAMPLNVAKQGIDFVLNNAVKLGQPGIEIAYHGGGEPTVNWNTLTHSFEYASSQAQAVGLEARASLATNGVMPDSKIDWIIEHLEGVSLSFDGLPEVHDKHRLNIAGAGSSTEVIRTIQRFDEADFNYGLRLTVTREHIPHIEASVKFICENFNPLRIQVEPAYQLGRWQNAPSAETEDFIGSFRAAQAVAYALGRHIEFSGARVGALSNHFCGISQDSFSLTADGQVSACYETFLEENEFSDTFFYGKHDATTNAYQFDLPVLENLRKQSVEHRDFCQGCYAKWTCGGDCYHKSLSVNGPGEFAGTDRCHIIRELTKDQILEKIRESGGLFWHEERADFSAPQGKEILQ